MTEALLTTRQVAEYVGVSPETVLRRWRAGELPGYRLASNVLRFRESEIEAWLEASTKALRLRGFLVKRAMGLEPTTPGLGSQCSTTELRPRVPGC